eukprot:g12275.t1
MVEDLDCSAILPDLSFAPHVVDRMVLSTCPEFVALYNRTFSWAEEERRSGSASLRLGSVFDQYLEEWRAFVHRVHAMTNVVERTESGDGAQQSEETDAAAAIELDGGGVAAASSASSAGVAGAGVDRSASAPIYTKGTWQLRLGEERGAEDVVSVPAPPKFANTTFDILRRHVSLLTDEVEKVFFQFSSSENKLVHDISAHQLAIPRTAVSVLHAAADAIYRRTCFLIENLSMSILTNFHIWRLEGQDGGAAQILANLWSPATAPSIGAEHGYHFHSLGPKRWNVLQFLVERVAAAKRTATGAAAGAASSQEIQMLEVGVDQANTTLRLLQTYDFLHHTGVDPWMNKPVEPGVRDVAVDGDRTHAMVLEKLRPFSGAAAGAGVGGSRSTILRMTSEEASKRYPDRLRQVVTAGREGGSGGADDATRDAGFDLIFLDALHDHASVVQDVLQWIGKLSVSGRHLKILCGHDFQWQYPGLPMAVATVAQRVKKVVHLGSDGMWWMEFD